LNICDIETTIEYSGIRVNGLKFYTIRKPVNNLPGKTLSKKLIFEVYPNPVVNYTQIKFEIPVTSRTTLDIYDLNGKLISSLFDNYLSAGLHTIKWEVQSQNGTSLNPGIYICSVRSKNYVNNIKLIVK